MRQFLEHWLVIKGHSLSVGGLNVPLMSETDWPVCHTAHTRSITFSIIRNIFKVIWCCELHLLYCMFFGKHHVVSYASGAFVVHNHSNATASNCVHRNMNAGCGLKVSKREGIVDVT